MASIVELDTRDAMARSHVMRLMFVAEPTIIALAIIYVCNHSLTSPNCVNPCLNHAFEVP